MRPIKIITDSCCDLPAPYRGKFDLSYIFFNLVIKGNETTAELDLTGGEQKDIYDNLRYGNQIYVLPATELAIRTKFQKYLDKGMDIIYVACSSDQSNTAKKAREVAERLMKENEGARIVVFDSGHVSFGEGLLAIKACEHRNEGKSIDEIIEALNEDKKHILQFITVENVVYLSRAGMIAARTEVYDRLLDMHPIIVADKNGRQNTLMRVKGFEKAVNKIIDLFSKNVVEPEKQHIFI
ncbi:MAG: DegV family EDD domain-containing protein, partial [Bacilli bacterium]|nr:DegV family EDD domain-containing protein [Bacilli bacterium]